jgi:penicillin amidase
MYIRTICLTAAIAAVAIQVIPAGVGLAQTVSISGLEKEVTIRRDSDGVSHIAANSAHDMFLAQGWQHAADRLFQMDVLRRQASGTLAELLGPDALAQDVELRTIGLRRSAERSLDAVSMETRRAFEAYAEGVNAYIAAHAPPPEYQALELTQIEPWTAVDSLAVAKLLSFSLSFDVDVSATIAFETYRAVGAAAGFDGAKLYFEDTHRSAPFDPAATVPDALAEPVAVAAAGTRAQPEGSEAPGRALGHAMRYLKRIENMPVFDGALHPNRYDRGSNAWAVAGWRTVEGRALLASDPHLQLTSPAVFHPVHLVAPSAGYDVIGDSLPGTPFVLLGQNRHLAWGATTNHMDVTDTYFEQIAPDAASPSGLSTVHDGQLEPLIPIPQLFCYNAFDGVPDTSACATPGGAIPPFTLISPRRNNGPVVDIDLAAGTALTIQYTGFSGTREADFFRLLDQAATLEDVTDALRYMDVGAQNFVIATRKGDIAYFTNAEVPLREDLEAGIPGAPFFIRDGTGGEEWLVDPNPPKDRATPYRIVPFAEMPQLVNPPSGVIVNANNDPLGLTLDNNPVNQLRPTGGLFYLAARWSFATRAGRIRDALAERFADDGLVGFVDMQEVQADVVMLDAQVLAPRIVEAFQNATAPGADPALQGFVAADPRLTEAVGRIAAWDGAARTGIAEGYDAADVDGVLTPPDADEIDASVAATIYSVWRARIVANTVDAVLDGIEAAASVDLPPLEDELAMTALRHLFDSFDANQGTGASGIEFFNAPFADAADRRDFIVLFSLQEALDALAGPDFAAAFGNSTDQEDYRWGKLHRLTLAHPMGAPFSVPPAFGAFPDPVAGLAGLPVDGGFGTVDAATHRLRADDSDGFVFADGPARRYVGEAGNANQPFDAESSLPGGASGVPGDPLQLNLLGRWLTNDGYILRQSKSAIAGNTSGTTVLTP